MWNWSTKHTLGSIILGILLLAIFGINRAASWLTQSTGTDTAENSVAISADDTSNDRGNLFGDRQRDDSFITQPDGAQNTEVQPDSAQSNSLGSAPLEQAGTYIQRQKQVETDPLVAPTQVAVEPATAAVGDTIEPDQPDTTEIPAPTPTPQPTTRPTAPAVPALW